MRLETNCFKVQDYEVFLKNMEKFEIADSIFKMSGMNEGKIMIKHDGDFQEHISDDDSGDEWSFSIEISKHLTEDSVCVIMAIVEEEVAVGSHWIMAIDSTGKEFSYLLNDFLTKAEEEFPGKQIR